MNQQLKNEVPLRLEQFNMSIEDQESKYNRLLIKYRELR